MSAPAPTAVVDAPPASRAERLILPAAFVTFLGNNVQLSASALLVVGTEHTALSVSWLFIAVAVPQALLAVPAGWLADRFDRRRVLIVCDIVGAAAAFALPAWLALGGAADRAAYAVNLALAVTAAVFLPASNALVRERVPAVRLGRFSARFEMVSSAGSLLSVAAGGFLVGLLGPVPVFLFNGFTFLASAACWAAAGRYVAGSAVRDAGEPSPEASREAGASPGVLVVGALYAVANVIIVVNNTLIVMLVVEMLHRGPGTLGVVDALAGTGMLLGPVWSITAGLRRARCAPRGTDFPATYNPGTRPQNRLARNTTDSASHPRDTPDRT